MIDRHAEWELSALLDGELPAADAEAVRAHVAACADCAAELAAVREARTALRSLPAVEPPPGFIDGLLATTAADEPPAGARRAEVVPLRGRRAALANAAAAVAAGVLLVVANGGTQAQAVSPSLDGVVERHASVLSAGLGGSAGSSGPSVRTTARVRPPFRAPQELAGYRLRGAYPVEGGMHLLYEKGRFALSVFEQEGELDPDDLPADGSHLRIDGDDAWRWDGDREGRVVVLERGDLVVTLVGEESGDAVEAAARALPGADGIGFGTRLKRACGEALEALSPAG